ncbi:PREDICTED: receptor-like protein kinase ANXUR2 [Theobroma cacao]|uniref:Receptor-like protein kinase ANXUR2 n=1 Tax=Theobroma cacao TaxID=3641 RepID=A0AB32V774_THECC|nr:PREDICTED: receptor-like protein kinase ANXUR2 [Theobroma cacao]
MATSRLPQRSSGKPPFANLCSLWRRGKTEENLPAWKKLYPRFQLEELLKATNNFDPALKVGEDSWDTVYEGYINDSYKYPVRIKRFKPHLDHQIFLTEMDLLSNLHHPNIVSLIGYCLDGSDRIIVLKHMAQGTLHDHLHGKIYYEPPLSWKRRLEICIGVARGLERLHTGNPLIIHRDIKSRNILLDQNWVANISNFQISKLVPSSLLESDSHVSTTVGGTLGYLDPEYAFSGHLSVKSDVYSFGVVLFEVLCGRTLLDVHRNEEEIELITWGRRGVEDGKLGQIIDPRLKGEIAPECLKAYAYLAYNCTIERGNERPGMSAVLKRLQLVLLLQECIEADIPYSPSWLTSLVPPPKSSEPLVDMDASEYLHLIPIMTSSRLKSIIDCLKWVRFKQ